MVDLFIDDYGVQGCCRVVYFIFEILREFDHVVVCCVVILEVGEFEFCGCLGVCLVEVGCLCEVFLDDV